jgi:CRP/FNR family transcriptional regulator
MEASKLTIRFNKGETIRKQGMMLTHVVSMHSGLAKLYLEGIEQRNAIVRIVKPCNFIGGPGIYFDRMHHYTLTALTDAIVCMIDVALFKGFIETNHVFFHEFMKDFSRNIIAINNRLLSLTQKQMPGRMADTLLYLMDEIFEVPDFPIPLSHQDLSELSAMSKESATKVLRDFTHEGIIRNASHKLEILDHEALKRISRIG